MTTFGRTPITVVELKPLVCTLTYGVGDCSAAVGVTGSRKCFNTRGTCQVLQDLVEAVSTIRFAEAQDGLPMAWDAIPSVVSVSTKPTKLNIGGTSRESSALGLRSTMTVVFQDHSHNDTGFDPYVSERSYTAQDRGTLWSKWLARNRNWQSIEATVRTGFAGQDLEDFTSSTFLVDTIDGPDASGRVRVTSRDVLSRADNRKAQAPRLSVGELQADISDSATVFNVIGEALANYGGSGAGTIRIGSEVMTYTSITDFTTYLRFNSVTRGTDGTTAAAHKEGDGVQRCLRFTAAKVQNIVKTLLEDYADIDSGFIPFADWDDEGDRWLLPYTLSALITKPEGVEKLITELAQQTLFYLWWSEKDQKIRFKALRPVEEQPFQYNDDNAVLADSQERRYDMNQQFSQVAFFYGQADPTKSLDDESNYRRVHLEVGQEFGAPRVRKIFSRWLNTQLHATASAATFMNQANDLPMIVKIKVPAVGEVAQTGDIVELTTRIVTDETGAQAKVRYIVIESLEQKAGEELALTLRGLGFFARVSNWMASDAPVFASATEEQKATGAWWSNDTGMLDGEPSIYVWS